jgi:hypothetical protein
MTLPTRENTKSYMIQKKDGSYEELVPHSKMMGWNVATIVVANHGRNPWTIDVDSSGKPVVGDGSDGNHRVIQRPLPDTDDLIGVRIVEILECEDDCDDIWAGCNIGSMAFALLALCFLFIRRK